MNRICAVVSLPEGLGRVEKVLCGTYLFGVIATLLYLLSNSITLCFDSLCGALGMVPPTLTPGILYSVTGAFAPLVFLVLMWLFRACYPHIRGFALSFDRFETLFLWGITLFFGALILWNACRSSAWVCPMPSDKNQSWVPVREGIKMYDSLFGTDVGSVVLAKTRGNLFFDYRHPYYQVVDACFMPFYAVLTPLVHYGLGGGEHPWLYSFTIAATLCQPFCWGIVMIMVGRMVGHLCPRRLVRAMMFLFAASFPVFIFSLALEKYALSAITMVGLVYFSLHYAAQERAGEKPLPGNRIFVAVLAFLGYSATLLTIALAPICMILRGWRSFWRYDVLALAILAVPCVLALAYDFDKCTRLNQFFSVSGTEQGSTNARMYLHFLSSNVYQPAYTLMSDGNNVLQTKIARTPWYYLAGGGLIAVLNFAAMLFYRHERFVWIAGLWILSSIYLLIYRGWGAVLDEMSLYSFYYSWAILPLTVLGAYRILGDAYRQTTVLVCVAAACTLFANLRLMEGINRMAEIMYIVP